MLNRFSSLFDGNKKQVKNTDKSVEQIKSMREKMASVSYKEMKKRISEM